MMSASGPAIVFTNTLTGERETFTPRRAGKVALFTCGPSVYSRPHIGNYRTYLYEDILHRFLVSRGYSLNRVLNFTDIEDKAIDEAKRRGLSLFDLTRPNEEQFLADADRLGIIRPSIIPRSSTSIPEAVRLISVLLDTGHAYWHRGDVFFDPLTHPEFGKLYGLDMSRWPKKRIRFRKDTYQGRRWNLGDFILWHGLKRGEDPAYAWETEIGPGRPAWNIQDPAMISKHLGYAVDICCGGVDNLYRHHDYNIAVLESVSGRELCHYWLHGELLLVNGSKMSKSRGNIVYPDTLFNEGLTPDQLRYFLLSVHYRRTMNLTSRRQERAKERLNRLQAAIRDLASGGGAAAPAADSAVEGSGSIPEAVDRALADDLDVPAAVTALESWLSRQTEKKRRGELGRPELEEALAQLAAADRVLGFLGLVGSAETRGASPAGSA